jgi:hypothetical protein
VSRAGTDPACGPVLLPSWAEFATVVMTSEDTLDRLLIALLGWCGLRLCEGVSLHDQVVWWVWLQFTVDRALLRRTQKEVDADTGLVFHLLENNDWRQESPRLQ